MARIRCARFSNGKCDATGAQRRDDGVCFGIRRILGHNEIVIVARRLHAQEAIGVGREQRPHLGDSVRFAGLEAPKERKRVAEGRGEEDFAHRRVNASRLKRHVR